MASQLQRLQRGLKRTKCCAHFFNALLLLAALGSIGISVWIFLTVWQHPAREGALHIVGIFYMLCNILPAGAGLLVAVIVFVGACGLCMTNRCALLWYFSLVLVAFVITIAAGVFNFIFYFRLQSTIAASLSTSVRDEYGLYGFEKLTESIDSVQTQFQCCGSLSYKEWRTSEWHRFQGLSHFRDSDVPTLPSSCCKMTTANGNESVPLNLTLCSHRDSTYPNDYMYSQNCSELIYQWLQLFTLILAAMCAVLFIAELMTITACALLFRHLGPVHYEEQKLMHKLKGDPDWSKRHGGGRTSRL